MKIYRFGKEVRRMGIVGLAVTLIPFVLPFILEMIKAQSIMIQVNIDDVVFWFLFTSIFPIVYLVGAHFFFDTYRIDETGIVHYAYGLRIKGWKWEDFREIGLAKNYTNLFSDSLYIYIAKYPFLQRYYTQILHQDLKRNVITLEYTETALQLFEKYSNVEIEDPLRIRKLK